MVKQSRTFQSGKGKLKPCRVGIKIFLELECDSQGYGAHIFWPTVSNSSASTMCLCGLFPLKSASDSISADQPTAQAADECVHQPQIITNLV